MKKVLAYDLGGTKLHAGVVTEKGKILEEVRVPAVFSEGRKAVIQQLTDVGREMIRKHPTIKRVGIASAGPLDPVRGLMLDPTNFGGNWHKVPLAKIMATNLKRPVVLENDAAAAMLAEHWMGKARRHKNAMILTLGTGLGVGVILNDELLRAGRGLHPEAGHIVIKHGDPSAPCGCGNLGCSEAYLSARSFSRRARVRFANADLMAKDLTDLARKNDPRAIAAFEEYAEFMAVAIHNFAVIYCPELIVFTGSFAEACDLFVPRTKVYLEKLLMRRREGIDLMPKLAVSSLHNKAGLLGGAHIAFNR